MIQTLTGTNVYARGQALGRATEAFLAEHSGAAVERYDGATLEASELLEAVRATSLFAPQKLMIIRGGGANPAFAGQIEDFIAARDPDVTVLLVEDQLDKRGSYYKTLKKQTDFHEFPELDRSALIKFADEYVRQLDASIAPGDAGYLVDKIGAHQQRLANELDKLALLGGRIDRARIDQLVEGSSEETAFALLDAVFVSGSSEQLRDRVQQLARHEDAYKFMGLLASQFYNLALVWSFGDQSEDSIAKASGLHPFVVKKLRRAARGVSAARLRQMTDQLVRADRQLKQVPAHAAWDTVTRLLLQLARAD